jgi:hypothetical protein
VGVASKVVVARTAAAMIVRIVMVRPFDVSGCGGSARRCALVCRVSIQQWATRTD